MTLMRDDTSNLRFTFPSMIRGKRERCHHLSALLCKGGAGASAWDFDSMTEDGLKEIIIKDRISLVQKLHECINSRLIDGGSSYTAQNEIRFLKKMFSWAEQEERPLKLESIQSTFLHWSDHLLHAYKTTKQLSQRSAYAMGSTVAHLLDIIFKRDIPIISLSRLKRPPTRKTAQGVAAEKQNLEKTFVFGYLLQDICDGLPIDTVLHAPLPIHIPLRCGKELIEQSGYHPWQRRDLFLSAFESGTPLSGHDSFMSKFKTYESEGTLKTRSPLANLRIEAELLLFIGQTGMNLAQAHKLKLYKFFYTSHLDGYEVRDWKNRRSGEVLFEIFAEYKPHFERYLEWRRSLFPVSDVLFPTIRKLGRAFEKHPQFRLRFICKNIDIKFVPPQSIRNTRVNWLLRRSGDEELTAEMAQHHKETLFRTYDRPSQQRAMGEIIRFWNAHDPVLHRKNPVSPGECDGNPTPISSAEVGTPTPDCMRPSGCVYCEHHRDIDSFDYIWALTCFRHLKIIEISRWGRPEHSNGNHPAELVIDRITQKLNWLKKSSKQRGEWVDEALARVEEGSYHLDFQRIIIAMERAQ